MASQTHVTTVPMSSTQLRGKRLVWAWRGCVQLLSLVVFSGAPRLQGFQTQGHAPPLSLVSSQQPYTHALYFSLFYYDTVLCTSSRGHCIVLCVRVCTAVSVALILLTGYAVRVCEEEGVWGDVSTAGCLSVQGQGIQALVSGHHQQLKSCVILNHC